MHRLPFLACLFFLVEHATTTAAAAVGQDSASAPVAAQQWEPVDIELRAAGAHPWWEFPVRATFAPESGESLVVEGFFDGGDRWIVRFAAPRAGAWTYRTASADRGLDGRTGRIVATAPTADDLARNTNLRGSVRIAPGGRHFQFADGTPFFLLADTVWAANTARCGLGEREDGPFFQWLADRKAKGFTAVLMQYFHGYGDYPDSPGHRNEGGHAFFDRDPARLNPAHFGALDRRMHGLWERGFVAAIPTTWWGKTKNCIFTPEAARRISAYCAVRYGAFNALWCLSGEYQYVFQDCGWKHADITALGETVQRHNPWRRPVSIHPGGGTHWPPPHGVQSSRGFHGEPWIDHHWLQTGQPRERLFNMVSRLAENRALAPAAPVFASEASYESAVYEEGAYHMRWQVWTAFLNGAAGYGYGTHGGWQFYDPNDPHGETGKKVHDIVPWREALALPGAGQLQHAKKLLAPLAWWKLDPQRERLSVDGAPNALPTATDLSPPHAAAIAGETATTTLIYLPRGDANREIALTLPTAHGIDIRSGDAAGTASARWFDPRTGEYAGEPRAVNPPQAQRFVLPARPAPAHEDWVFVLTHPRRSRFTP